MVIKASAAASSSARPAAIARAKRRPSGGGLSQRDWVSDIDRLLEQDGISMRLGTDGFHGSVMKQESSSFLTFLRGLIQTSRRSISRTRKPKKLLLRESQDF
jgi:hypothetical protein